MLLCSRCLHEGLGEPRRGEIYTPVAHRPEVRREIYRERENLPRSTESKARFPPAIYGPLEKGRAHLPFQRPDVQRSVRSPDPDPHGAGAPILPDIPLLQNHDSEGENARNRFGGSISPLSPGARSARSCPARSLMNKQPVRTL